MKLFWKKLSDWVENNHDKVVMDSFKTNDGTIISPDTSMGIWQEHTIYEHLIEEIDKLSDYNRLLRKENRELTDRVDTLEFEIDTFTSCCKDESENNSELLS